MECCEAGGRGGDVIGAITTRGNVLQSARPRLCRKSIARLMLCVSPPSQEQNRTEVSAQTCSFQARKQGSNTSGPRCCRPSAQQADTASMRATHARGMCLVWEGGAPRSGGASPGHRGQPSGQRSVNDSESACELSCACDAGAELPTQGKLHSSTASASIPTTPR